MSDQVKIKVGVDGRRIKSGLAKLKGDFAGLKNSFVHAFPTTPAQLALKAVEVLGEAGRAIFNKAGQLQDLSERFDISAEALQRIGNVAEQSGASLEVVARSVNKLVLNQQKCTDSSSEQAQALRELNIDAEEFAGLSAEDAFNRIADATYTAGDRGKAYAAVVQLMGKQAGDLFTTLELGSEGIRAASDEMGVFSDKTVETIDRVGDKLDTLVKKFLAFGANLIAPVLDVLVPDDPKAEANRKATREAAKKVGGSDTEGSGGAKNDVFAADALTRAGGGGIAYFGSKNGGSGRDKMEDLAQTARRQETVLNEIKMRLDPVYQKRSPAP